MLIGADGEPFDSPDYIYELKLDGERCIAYLDPKEGTELRNKRNVKMLPKVPELGDLHKQAEKTLHLGRRVVDPQRRQAEFCRNPAAQPHEQPV